MKKIIRDVDPKRGICQITVADERWYTKPTKDPQTGIPTIKAVPSVTWIVDYWPNKFLENWRAEKGIDEAEAIKRAARDKGSAVHLAIEKILRGEELRIDTKVEDKTKSTEQDAALRELTYEELVCIQSFIEWRNEVKPEVIATETTVFSDTHNYAGTVDFVCRIEGVPYVIDFKTSKQVSRAHELQVSAYRVALENGENPLYEKNPNGTETGKLVDVSGLKTAILQLGYTRNKAGYKFTEIEDAFPLFKVAQQIWKAEVGDNTPGFTKRDFPIVLSPASETTPKVDEARPTAPERGTKTTKRTSTK
jgi:PD-(D/E)XK nuclease superfamily